MDEAERRVLEREALEHVPPDESIVREISRPALVEVEAHYQGVWQPGAQIGAPLSGSAADVEDATWLVDRREIQVAHRHRQGVVLDVEPIDLFCALGQEVGLAWHLTR